MIRGRGQLPAWIDIVRPTTGVFLGVYVSDVRRLGLSWPLFFLFFYFLYFYFYFFYFFPYFSAFLTLGLDIPASACREKATS